MQVVLVMFRPDGQRRSFSIVRDMSIIGRRNDCDLRIPLGDVSRKHCRLIKDGDLLRVEDLGSSNGTFHNGERVQQAILEPGDTLQIGPVVFVAQIDGNPPDEELIPITTASRAAAESEEVTQLEEEDAAAPAKKGDEFDPMEALSGDPDESQVPFDMNLEEDDLLAKPASAPAPVEPADESVEEIVALEDSADLTPAPGKKLTPTPPPNPAESGPISLITEDDSDAPISLEDSAPISLEDSEQGQKA